MSQTVADAVDHLPPQRADPSAELRVRVPGVDGSFHHRRCGRRLADRFACRQGDGRKVVVF
jgi:hypothetical protein